MRKYDFNFYFKIYLTVLYLFAVFFFFQKYNNNVEWTISEWLINYQGGFTRRGLIGELVFQFSKIISVSVREVILIFQIITYLIYFSLLFYFFKNVKKNLILIFSIFSPLFIIYPIAEVEVLGRKEIFIFISFLIIINIFSSKKLNNKQYLYFSIILSLICLIWEGVVIYLPYFLFLLLIKNKFVLNKKNLFQIILSFVPILITFYFIFSYRLSSSEIKIMCDSIGECYGAITYLNRDISSNIGEVASKFKISYLIRYIIIFIVGFFPLILLIVNSKFNFKYKYQNSYLVLISFILTFLPTLSFFYIAQDWGRWMNISYTLSLLLFVFCLKNKCITLNIKKIDFNILKNKFFTIFVFIVFCFGWSPKTLINEDVSSIPIYRKSLNIIKSFD
tara:strand:+ start:1042 stop:2214 length:1173 start_codon:yes stop_codon:yes gene_type:complete